MGPYRLYSPARYKPFGKNTIPPKFLKSLLYLSKNLEKMLVLGVGTLT
jgi:hypothetical protein